jgi:hypothetical protein
MILLLCVAHTSLPFAQGLSDFVWSHRILLVAQNEVTQSQLTYLESVTQEIDERRLKIFLVAETEVIDWRRNNGFDSADDYQHVTPALTRTLQNTIRTRLGDKACLLIGLDGGDKQAYSGLAIESVFGDIDLMPMRRSEPGFNQ